MGRRQEPDDWAMGPSQDASYLLVFIIYSISQAGIEGDKFCFGLSTKSVLQQRCLFIVS
jgi:hypothetical protein